MDNDDDTSVILLGIYLSCGNTHIDCDILSISKFVKRSSTALGGDILLGGEEGWYGCSGRRGQ